MGDKNTFETQRKRRRKTYPGFARMHADRKFLDRTRRQFDNFSGSSITLS
jgi:hypothetical protein